MQLLLEIDAGVAHGADRSRRCTRRSCAARRRSGTSCRCSPRPRRVGVGVERGLLRADQHVERIGDAVVVAIVARRAPSVDPRRRASSGASSSRSPGRSASCELADLSSARRRRRADRPCAGSRRSTARARGARRSTVAATRAGARPAGSASWTCGSRSRQNPGVGHAERRLRRVTLRLRRPIVRRPHRRHRLGDRHGWLSPATLRDHGDHHRRIKLGTVAPGVVIGPRPRLRSLSS